MSVKFYVFFSDTLIIFPIAFQFRVFRSWTKDEVYDPMYTLMLSCLCFHMRLDFKRKPKRG